MSIAELVDRLATLPPRAADTRVVLLDGRSGAGKTTLGVRLAEGLGATLVQLEDLYPGWDGLADGIAVAAREVLAPLATGRPGSYRRWDWYAAAHAERHEVPAGGMVVVEGVGAAASALRPFGAASLWVEAPESVRRRRAFGRSLDAEVYVDHWDRWAAQERAYLARDRPGEHADVVIDGVESDLRADRLVLSRAHWPAPGARRGR